MNQQKIVWMADVSSILEIFELGRLHGKKEGDSLDEEVLEYAQLHPDKVQILGIVDDSVDIDLIAGNLREEGIRVKNLRELERRKDDNSEL